jgi:predicted ribosomally synthesized peptide with nif11-like leader
MDFKDISPELREKAKACQTPEEMLALAKKEGYKLSEEDLEAISGGRWSCGSYCSAYCTAQGVG